MQRFQNCIDDDEGMRQSIEDLLQRWLCEIMIGEEDPHCTLKKGPLFSEKIHYVQDEHDTNADITGVTALPQYNGNVSMVEWHAVGMDVVPVYGFTYDAQDQLTNADYVEHNFYHLENDLPEWINRGMYNTEYSYADLAGNIGNIKRWSYKPDVVEDVVYDKYLIDDLELTYNGNRLQSVTESAETGAGYGGSGGFTYDAKGNITSHGAKGIETIQHNHLDRPVFIENALGTMTMTYDADGNKTKHLIQGPQGSEKIEYIDGIEYRDNKISTYATPVGRLVFDQDEDITEYYLSDHLGNTRVVFTDRDGDGIISRFFEDMEVTTVEHYYPFGMPMKTPAPGTMVAQSDQVRRRYNSIEHFGDMELGLDMAFYRTLDPGLGRWMSVDPKAEMGYGMSTYCSMGNSPMTHVDPEGDFPLFAIGFAAMTYMSSQAFSGNLTSTGDFYGAMAIGAAQGAASYGIGAAFGPTGSVVAELGRAGAHGLAGGVGSIIQGGSFASGFWSGAISSGIGSGIEALGGGTAGQLFGAGLSGGIGAELAGGNFLNGAWQGLVVGALNHAMHGTFSSGGPPWEYNGKMYKTKGALYRAILLDQAAEQFGIKDLVALAAAVDNAGLVSKPFQTKGASKGTSYASKYGAKLLPQEMSGRLPTHIRGGKVRYTKVLGRFLGRMAGPIGWGILAYDVGMTLYNTQTTYNGIINN